MENNIVNAGEETQTSLHGNDYKQIRSGLKCQNEQLLLATFTFPIR